MNIKINKKDDIILKILHYFITEEDYKPVIINGLENEIWLENMDEDYKIIRIVSNYIHNKEQFDFDMFKTKRIVKKIKKKTLSLNINTLSIFLSLGDNVDLSSSKNVDCIMVNEEEDLKNSNIINIINSFNFLLFILSPV